MEIYLAAPLFSQAERVYNRRLKEMLERLVPSCKVTLPQDFRIAHGGSYNDRRHLATLYKQCMEALARADLVLARLDGADADSGVAFEVGFARGVGKPVIGIRTDYRRLQDRGLNMMLAQGCTDIMCRFSFDERMEPLAEALVGRIEKALASRGR